MLIKQKTPKIKVSLKEFQHQTRKSPNQQYQSTYVSSQIEYAQQKSQDFKQYFPQPDISRMRQNQRPFPRKKIFGQESRSKSPINAVHPTKNQNHTFIVSIEQKSLNLKLPSIKSFGKISQQKYLSKGCQNSVPSPFSSKFIQQQEVKLENNVLSTKKHQKNCQIIQYNNQQTEKFLFNAQQHQELKKKITQIQKEVKQIHYKIDERSIDQNSWRKSFRNELIEHQKHLLNKQHYLKRSLSKMEQLTRASYGNETSQENNAFSSIALNKSSSVSQLQMARNKRLEELSRQNDRLKHELTENASTIPAVMQNYTNFAYDRQWKSTEYDSFIYTNEEKLKMKLNSISALTKINDEDEYSEDGQALGQLLSPFAFDPDHY